jgi:hypothetical protein
LIALAAIARSHGGFFPRYGLPACFSIAVFTVVLLWKYLRQSRAMALLVAAALCFLPLWNGAVAVSAVAASRHKSAAGFESVEPSLPLVTASGLTYIEMNHRESPALLSRVYFLQDRAAEIQYAHSTLFDSEDVVTKMFHFPSKVEALSAFEAEHPRFLVLGTVDYPEDWLLRKLEADGDVVRHLRTYNTSYKDKDLYEVTIRQDAQGGSGNSAHPR